MAILQACTGPVSFVAVPYHDDEQFFVVQIALADTVFEGVVTSLTYSEAHLTVQLVLDGHICISIGTGGAAPSRDEWERSRSLLGERVIACAQRGKGVDRDWWYVRVVGGRIAIQRHTPMMGHAITQLSELMQATGWQATALAWEKGLWDTFAYRVAERPASQNDMYLSWLIKDNDAFVLAKDIVGWLVRTMHQPDPEWPGGWMTLLASDRQIRVHTVRGAALHVLESLLTRHPDAFYFRALPGPFARSKRLWAILGVLGRHSR